MKTLYIVRHAKSDWGHEGLKDIDRPLNQRGYGDAYLMSKNFFKAHGAPELLVSSTAIRAISTAMIFARSFGYHENAILILENIYEVQAATLKKVINGFDDKKNRIMLFGHNPGLTNLFNDVSDSFADNIPTCGIIGIEFNAASWSKVFSSEGKTLFSDFPKEFKP